MLCLQAFSNRLTGSEKNALSLSPAMSDLSQTAVPAQSSHHAAGEGSASRGVHPLAPVKRETTQELIDMEAGRTQNEENDTPSLERFTPDDIFELYIKMHDAKEIYNLIIDKGKEFNLSHCGMLAMDTMRMEKGYLHWGHDMSPEENQYEAGLKFAINFKKNINFVGKKAIDKIKSNKIKKKWLC